MSLAPARNCNAFHLQIRIFFKSLNIINHSNTSIVLTKYFDFVNFIDILL